MRGGENFRGSSIHKNLEPRKRWTLISRSLRRAEPNEADPG